MESSVLSGLSAGGLGGVIIALAFIIYKCCQGKKLHSECCGGKFDVAQEQQPPPQPQSIIIQQTPPLTATEPPKERRVSTLQV
jgi:hypothetical protein